MIIISINTCRECNELTEERDYTADSFEYCTKGICNKTKRKKNTIFRYLDWNRKPPPTWCPKRVKKINNINI